MPGKSYDTPDPNLCPTCGKVLPLSEFYRNGNYKDGLPRYHSRCKTCFNQYKGRPRQSPCWTCHHLELCKSIIWTMTPLPCFSGDIEPPELINCENCGKVTEKRDARQRFCCDKCQMQSWRRRKKEQRYANQPA